MLKGIIAPPPAAAAPASLGSVVTSVALTGPAEFFISGSPIIGSGTLDFQFTTPTLVAHGGTGMGSFAANSILQAGPTSTAPFTSVPLNNLTSNFLRGDGVFAAPPPPPAGGAGTVTSVDLSPTSEFVISGNPVTGAGTLLIGWKSPVPVAHGGTGMGSFAANSLLQAGLSSTAKFQSIPLTNLSSNFLDGTGRFSIPPAPAAAAAGTSFGGTAIVDFGAFPGATDATVAVVDARVGASTVIVVTIDAVDSVDHSADEHLADPPRVQPGEKTVGSFNVHAFTTDQYFKYGKWNVAYTGTG